MSKTQFEALDLFFFALLAGLAECINIWAFNKFTGIFYVSYAIVLGLIAIVRWNYVGIVVPIIAGGAMCIYEFLAGKNESLSWILANTAGYLPLLAAPLWFKFKDKKNIMSDGGFFFGYVISGFLIVEIGRSLCYVWTSDFKTVLVRFFAYDLINMALGLLVFFIACKQKKIVYDMNDYLVEEHQGTPEGRTRAAIRSEKEDYKALEEMADNDEVSDIALLDGGMLTDADLKKMDETYKKMEGKPSKYDEQREAIKKYHEEKKNNKKHTEGK